MSITYNVTLPIVASTQAYAFYPGHTGVSVTYALSTEPMLQSPLSGADTYCHSQLICSLSTNGGPVFALSAAAGNIILRYPSAIGNQDLYGRLTTSTFSSAASSFTATIAFDNLNFFNTSISLSGNKTTSIIESSTTIDNPMYNLDAVLADTQSANLKFRTVGRHVRAANLNG